MKAGKNSIVTHIQGFKRSQSRQTRIDKQNVVKVTKEVKDLTSQSDDMNEADAILIADVIGDVVSLEDSLNEVISSRSASVCVQLSEISQVKKSKAQKWKITVC